MSALAIGPEGGWSQNELDLAADRVSLAATVLRVETAAVVAGARLTVRTIEHAACEKWSFSHAPMSGTLVTTTHRAGVSGRKLVT